MPSDVAATTTPIVASDTPGAWHWSQVRVAGTVFRSVEGHAPLAPPLREGRDKRWREMMDGPRLSREEEFQHAMSVALRFDADTAAESVVLQMRAARQEQCRRVPVEAGAACEILQRVGRGCYVRQLLKMVALLRTKTRVIQRAVRCFQARRHAEQLRLQQIEQQRTRAAMVMQCFYRRFVHALRAARRLRSADAIARSILAVEERRHVRDAAVLTLQRGLRAAVHRAVMRKLHLRKLLFVSGTLTRFALQRCAVKVAQAKAYRFASTIQRAWRCYFARRLSRWLRRTHTRNRAATEDRERRAHAALLVQTRVRRHQAQTRVDHLRRVRTIHDANTHVVEQLCYHTIRLQRWWRRVSARTILLARRTQQLQSRQVVLDAQMDSLRSLFAAAAVAPPQRAVRAAGASSPSDSASLSDVDFDFISDDGHATPERVPLELFSQFGGGGDRTLPVDSAAGAAREASPACPINAAAHAYLTRVYGAVAAGTAAALVAAAAVIVPYSTPLHQRPGDAVAYGFVPPWTRGVFCTYASGVQRDAAGGAVRSPMSDTLSPGVPPFAGDAIAGAWGAAAKPAADDRGKRDSRHARRQSKRDRASSSLSGGNRSAVLGANGAPRYQLPGFLTPDGELRYGNTATFGMPATEAVEAALASTSESPSPSHRREAEHGVITGSNAVGQRNQPRSSLPTFATTCRVFSSLSMSISTSPQGTVSRRVRVFSAVVAAGSGVLAIVLSAHVLAAQRRRARLQQPIRNIKDSSAAAAAAATAPNVEKSQRSLFKTLNAVGHPSNKALALRLRHLDEDMRVRHDAAAVHEAALKSARPITNVGATSTTSATASPTRDADAQPTRASHLRRLYVEGVLKSRERLLDLGECEGGFFAGKGGNPPSFFEPSIDTQQSLRQRDEAFAAATQSRGTSPATSPMAGPVGAPPPTAAAEASPEYSHTSQQCAPSSRARKRPKGKASSTRRTAAGRGLPQYAPSSGGVAARGTRGKAKKKHPSSSGRGQGQGHAFSHPQPSSQRHPYYPHATHHSPTVAPHYDPHEQHNHHGAPPWHPHAGAAGGAGVDPGDVDVEFDADGTAAAAPVFVAGPWQRTGRGGGVWDHEQSADTTVDAGVGREATATTTTSTANSNTAGRRRENAAADIDDTLQSILADAVRKRRKLSKREAARRAGSSVGMVLYSAQGDPGSGPTPTAGGGGAAATAPADAAAASGTALHAARSRRQQAW